MFGAVEDDSLALLGAVRREWDSDGWPPAMEETKNMRMPLSFAAGQGRFLFSS